jgi:hypothetical protein
MTTRPRSQALSGAFTNEHAELLAALTILEWRRLDAEHRRLRGRPPAFWRQSR